MTANEIRKKFLDFFKSKKHTIVESDSLVPKNDPTVLFTTAGMQQFKQQFLGHIDGYTRAATSQKCLRTDDLDEVGETDFHHTFFEMLGNFSFGDYFKKDAIHWGWQFLTKEMKIPAEKLWVSVYKEDTETEEIWLKEIGIPKDKLVKLGDKSNFWPANAKVNGPNGPCGPCSEIFYDYGENSNCSSKICDPSCDCGRFSEVWNLVFTQFERKEGGLLEPLPNKNIDTGMGLERLCSVVQGKKNNFETDVFEPILKSIDHLTTKEKITITLKEKRILADHIRAITFSINDGVIPSNKERGYVVKVLINRCATILLDAGAKKELVFQLVDGVVEAMQEQYPELVSKSKSIQKLVKGVESAYMKTRKEKIPNLIEKFKLTREKSYDSSQFANEAGKIIFEFKDTHGLQLETILKILNKECGLIKEEKKEALEEYDRLMNEQKERSRASSKMAGDVFTNNQLELNVPKTKFIGYDRPQSTSTILAIYIENEKTHLADEGCNVKIVLDKTPFYAESGGQVGDTGTITSAKCQITITDTQKISDVFIHIGVIKEGSLRVNDQVTAQIDIERRLAIMRNHTATHLLQSALREVIGEHVQQQGSYVSKDRLRFDFTHSQAVTNKELKEIEFKVNSLIVNCESVTKEFQNIKKAKDMGALAFFAEKYSETVRVISIGNYSKEFCGGTHLDSTGQIGLFKIISESAIAQGIRRIEAKTGLNALDYISMQENQLNEIAHLMKSPLSEIGARIKTQANRIKEFEKELAKYKFEAMKGSLDSILKSAEVVNGIKLISHYFTDADMTTLKKVSDLIKNKTEKSVITLGSKTNDSASIIIAVSDDLILQGIKANELINEISLLIDGKGGGRPQMAQAGSKNIGNIENAIQKANEILKGKIAL